MIAPATVTRPKLDARDGCFDSSSHRAARLCCGVRVEFEAHTSEWLNSLTNVIPGVTCQSESAVQARFAVRKGGPPSIGESDSYEIQVNGTSIRTQMSAQGALTFMERHVPEAIAVLSQTSVLVHAAVVGWQERAILLPGSSWSGKTTLAMALVEAGAIYYSDEYAILDRDAKVYAYLRPPRARDAAVGETANRLNHAISLGLAFPPPLPVGLVLITQYSAGAVWSPRPLTYSEAVFEMLAHTVAVRYKPELSLGILRQVGSSARSFQTKRGDARATARAILSLLQTDSLN